MFTLKHCASINSHWIIPITDYLINKYYNIVKMVCQTKNSIFPFLNAFILARDNTSYPCWSKNLRPD